MPFYLSEIETRKQLIDKELSAAGWGDAEKVRVEVLIYAVAEESDGFADYVLLDSRGNPLAIVEAKKTSRDELSGKRQAADYADAIERKTGFDPFIFLTNGKEVQFWDRAASAPRKVSGFYSQADLERMEKAEAILADFKDKDMPR
ncbi:MAG: type I restriction endonuclease, partial [Thiolinea sp.]